MRDPGLAHLCHEANIKSPQAAWGREIEGDDAKENHKTSCAKIERRFPSCCLAVSRAPDPNHDKNRDECNFVKTIKKKSVDGRESSEESSRNQQETTIKKCGEAFGFRSDDDCCE